MRIEDAMNTHTRSSAASGYTKPLTITIPASGDVLHVNVLPGTDLDGRFTAWDTECLDFIRINGWMVNIESRGDTAKSRESGEGHV